MGISQLLLTICITIWPNATHDEISLFIFGEGGGIYDNCVISKWMEDLEIT